MKTMRPLAYGEDHIRVSVDGMEALGRLLEKGEIDEAELESLGAWKEEKKEKNLEGNTVTRRKQKPVRISKEALEFAEGARHKRWDEMMGRKKEEENEENEEEDEALLEGSEEEIEEEMNENEMNENENENEEEMSENEEEMNENEEENENENELSENENEMNENPINESNESEEAEGMEEETDSDSMSPQKAEEVRQRRIALAREFMSTHILPPKLFRLIQGDRSDSESSDSDSETDENVDVANEIVSIQSIFHV